MKSEPPKFLRVFLIASSLALIFAGVLLGENAAIFQKAVFVCMECIGLG
ncbi:hypothetical protein HRI96_01225 [Treponema parvum]|uniref:Thioredoxin n=1 Tax=Treponema parvum TaxID=138851 RepID=A0A975IBJ0_9SPIR|nr:CD1871A family CXXC motif-containing protein [Treponema parvum]QTQ10935.1 hypothetical protein HRI96_01225 [Treponema parvum]QTQ14912.1 hypothetical protein HRQ91_10835 [Treponema parvum]QTQ17119.1 hypothetical protein HXT04_10690 [Treponema parvum]